jgi:acyl-CoA synthetase (AMP-forming)/AMP-acid ligase II
MGGFQVLLQALVNGSSIVYGYKKDKLHILENIKKFGVTHISATPTFYKLLHPLKQTFPDVSRVTLGGEKSDDFTFNLVSRIFPNAKITNIYALTEAGSVLYSNTNVFKINKDCKVINDTLYVRDASGQFIDTGDLVSLLDDSSFIFCGRKKNIINIAGNDVNPSEVEELIKKEEGIKDAIVYNLSNSRFGNVLVCDIVKLNKDKSENDIKQHLKKMHLEDYKVPKIINFVDNLKISENLKSIP